MCASFSPHPLILIWSGHVESVDVVFFTLTDRASTIHSNIRGCQSGTWSQRVTKVNGSHMVTTRCSDQQGSKSRQNVMRLYKQWPRPISKRFIKPPYSISRAASIDSDCCRLPTTSVLGNKPDKLRFNLIDQQVQVTQGHTLYKKKGKLKYRGPWWWRP